MSATDHRDYVHPETGEVFVPKEDLENCEAELRKLRRRLKAYERQKQDEREKSPNRTLILALIERWKVQCDHPNSNAHAADRFDMVQARLREGYTPEQIAMAIDGIAAMPYVGPQGRQSHNGRGSKRHDRMGIALGSGEDLERFANMGAQARRNGGVPNLGG
jgi:hypothetical protein